MDQYYYPVSRLIESPGLFLPLAVQIGRFFSPDELRDLFFEAYAAATDPDNTGDKEGEELPEDVCFSVTEDDPEEGDIAISIIFDNQIGMVLKGHRKGPKMGEEPQISIISNENELQRVSRVYNSIVRRLEKEKPELESDICLEEVPSESNNFLQDKNNKGVISGSFRLLSDPDRKFAYQIRYDPNEKKTDTFITD